MISSFFISLNKFMLIRAQYALKFHLNLFLKLNMARPIDRVSTSLNIEKILSMEGFLESS